MQYTHLGRSGLRVSRIIMGCMGFGDPSKDSYEWAIDIDEARPLIKQALEAGITTFDTANIYSAGVSEEIVGKVLGELARRDEVIIATKVCAPMGSGPKDVGLSRAAIFAQVEQSLRRLKTDYIDLYQIHRYDPNTPIEETMEALNDLVRSGKVRYIGASSMWTWQFVQAQYIADLHGWTRFISMQDHYNLLTREEEREMHPFCLDQGIGVIPWSPLALGSLTRDWDTTTARQKVDWFGQSLYQQARDASHTIVDTVAKIAAQRGVSRAQIALAWVLQKPAVTAPIIGVTKTYHLTDAVAALDVHLDEDEMRTLEAPYVPQLPQGFV